MILYTEGKIRDKKQILNSPYAHSVETKSIVPAAGSSKLRQGIERTGDLSSDPTEHIDFP